MADLKPCPFCGTAARHMPFKAAYCAETAICDVCRVSAHVAIWNHRATEAEATGKQGVGDEEDDSLLLCLSDLEHSAIYDNSAEMPRCVRAVTKRMRALLSRAAPSATVDVAGSGEAVAHVPVHPRNGPLWADTIPVGSNFQRSEHYPRMALYTAAPTPTAPDDVAREVAKIVAVDEYGPQIQWSTHWADLVGKTLCVKGGK